MRTPPLETLLQAVAGAHHGATDPRLQSLQPGPHVAQGATDPRLHSSSNNPGVALINAYQEYLRSSGREQDPLGARIGQKGQPGLGGSMALDPIKLMQFGGQPFRQITHGENAGQFAQTYDLGNGQKANVYYDRGGKRRVRVYTP